MGKKKTQQSHLIGELEVFPPRGMVHSLQNIVRVDALGRCENTLNLLLLALLLVVLLLLLGLLLLITNLSRRSLVFVIFFLLKR